MQIKIFNRMKGQIEIEKVMAEDTIRLLYSTFLGRFFLPVLTLRVVSMIMGAIQNSAWSAKKIPAFIKNFSIPIDLFLSQNYKNFNEFFIRQYKDGVRNFEKNPELMPAFCEARYFGVSQVKDQLRFPVKGQFLSAKALLSHSDWEKTFEGGPLLIARLCPVDYHWFHYPDDGEVLASYRIPGAFHSVSPIALKSEPEVFCMNERQVTILQTKNFGKLAYVEVGAMCVGRIVQTHNQKQFLRGEQKGHFLFGGSTVIVLGEKGLWKPTDDILYYSLHETEVLLELGIPCAEKISILRG